MKSPGIRFQILSITLIPVFLIGVFFTYNHIENSIAQANRLLQSKGRISAQQIAGASGFSLVTGNLEQLKHLLEQSADGNDILLAAVYDHRGNLAAEAKSEHFDQAQIADYFYFRESILAQGPVQADAFATGFDENRQPRALGWVHLYISRQQLELTRGEIIFDSIVFFLSMLLMAIILTAVISRRITKPIFGLVEHLKQVETGQLGRIIEPTEENEIGSVQKGFNRMTQSLATNRRHLNQRIQQATQQLNEAITDLEAKNREIGFARDQAQSANRSKSEFLANMSHEIRTPINGIKGFISLLGQSDLDHAQQRYVDILQKSTNDLSKIVNEILDFSKMESGKLHIVDEEFDLWEVVEQTRDILFINVLTKSIDLNLIIFSDTPRLVVGDKLRLKQILLNLIGNAIKFTDHGQVVIRVSLQDMVEDTANIEISVEDSGIGISEDDQQNLFQAFSQVENLESRRFPGTGLGLVISKNLARLMGGDISMFSEPGKGSRFALMLPFECAPSAAEQADRAPLDYSALIFAARQNCMMETRTLFDRAGIATESSLVDPGDGPDRMLECIQRNLPYIDLLVIDLRHLEIDLDEILSGDLVRATRVLLVDYDRGLEHGATREGVEFISVVSTSQAVADQVFAAERDPSSPAPGREPPRQDRKKVLLVDDNLVNLKLAGEMIRLWGHEPIEAENGREALDLYRQHAFDLIILDIQMPDIDGVSLRQMMREARPEDTTPVAALTANVLNGEAERLYELGFDFFLSKPIDEARFRALLDGDISGSASVQRESAAESENLAVDYARSLQLSADNESLLRQIFEIIQRDIPEQQNQLAEALRQHDRDRLAAIAHKLHGVTCYASLPRLRRKVLALQQRLTRDSGVTLEQSVEEINSELGTISREVETFLQQMEQSGISS